MNKNGLSKGIDIVLITFLVLLAANTVLMAFVSVKFMIISLIFLIVGSAFTVYYVITFNRYFKKFILTLDSGGAIRSKALSQLKMPVIYTNVSGEIIWYNSVFEKYLTGTDAYGADIFGLLKFDKEEIYEKGFCELIYKSKEFTLYYTVLTDGKNKYFAYFLTDNTVLKRAAREYYASKPAVMMIKTDNFNDLTRNCKDSERSSFLSAIHKEIENWLADIKCININLRDNDVYVLLQERDLVRLIESKFSVLDSVRKLGSESVSGVTLSIGVGRGGANLEECESLCKQAIEMAQSRGGDQAAIRNRNNEYQFFGGVSSSVQKSNKVRVRVVASAIYEMISAADNVVLMGHKYSDLDCLGASYALAEVAISKGKNTFIVFDPGTTLAGSLYDRIIEENKCVIFTDGSNLSSVVGEKTLLIVSDTHRASFCENPNIFDMVKNIIVIDHHRKSVDAISDAVIFYHETAASSACELVGELLQYMPGVSVSKLAADALLAGITLDTKNFCLHTGARTFEAAAYIKNCGADSIRVRKFFSDNRRTYVRKAQVVANAQLYENCAISFEETDDDITRIVSSQAADELLNLQNVSASFVLCHISGGINISARSYGEINVQLIMEKLGGGGHQNMAACQLRTVDFADAKKALIKAIDEYKESL